MQFESLLQHSLFNQSIEKTSIDKILAREDVQRAKELVKKSRLTREELLEVLYLLVSTEAKLLNLSEWDRYILLKFFVWIREFIKVAELLYDYQDELTKQQTAGELVLSDRTRRFINNNERLIEHNAKFLIDLYFNISRTTISLGATGLLELIKNKYELIYPQDRLTEQRKPEAPVMRAR